MKTSSDPRHLRREKIVQELFAWGEQQKLKSHPDDSQIADKAEWDEKTNAIIKIHSDIDEIITQCAPDWTIEKTNEIDLAILRLAVYELAFEAIEPAKAIIDEAVEIAKEFGTDNSASFVNGALGKCLTCKKRILKLIANRTGVEDVKLEETTELTELNLSDLELNDMLVILEKELQTTFPSKSDLKTVGDIVATVEDNEV